MKATIDKDRFCQYIMMLIHLVEGNFSVRIPIKGKRDQFRVAEVFVNKLADGIDQIFKHTAHLKPMGSRDFMLLLSLDLNKDFKIVNSNTRTRKLLKYKTQDLEGRPLKEFLNKKSQKKWRKFKKQLGLPIIDPPMVELSFLSATGLEISTYCEIDEIKNIEGYKYRLTSMVSFLHEEFIFKKEEEEKAKAYEKNKNPRPLSILDRPDDLEIVYKVREEVIKLSEGPLPKMPELANKFATNETKLRKDFKEKFSLTIIQLHTRLRVINAKLEIEGTDVPIMTIASSLGFVSYSAFVDTFKDLFGYSPRTARARARAHARSVEK